MGLTVTIGAQKQTNVVFGDLAALNRDLFDGPGIGELLGDYDNHDFIHLENGEIQFQERDDDAYYKRASVWGCFGLEEAQIIAKHMTAGKLILRMDIEGNEPEWFIIEPGKATKTDDPF